MTINYIYNILFNGEKFSVPQQEMENVALCHDFLKSFVEDKVIYGINTGFGMHAFIGYVRKADFTL